MAIQTLLAAFSFGLVTQAAGGAIFLHSKNHVRILLRDSRRLVLILFLLLAILWSVTQFIDLFLPDRLFIACYTIVIFSTLFDQLARVAFHQYILWAIGEAVKSTAIRLIFYGILVIRLLAGGVLLGFTRPNFAPTCVARRSNIYGSLLVLALDGLILVIVITRLLVVMKRQNGSNQSIQAKAKGRALIFGIFGFMVWTGTSVPMILGFSEFMLLLKTLLPAVGILIIIGIITIMPGYFVTQSQDTISTTDALSPYMGPASSSQNAAKVSAGSPSSAYMRGRSLYVVNPSSTPNDSPTPFGPSRGITKTNENTPQNSVVNINESNDSVPTFLTNAKLRENSTSDTIQSTSSYTPGYRGSSGIFPPQGNNQAALAPAIVGEIGPNPGTVNPTSTLPLIKRSILKWPLKSEKQSIRNLPISNPIYLDEKENDFESFVRMPTVELEQAIFNERQRRDAQAAKSNILSDASTRNSLTILRANLEPTTEINPANLKTTNIIVKSSSNEDKEIIFSASQIDEVVTASEINVNKDTKIASILTPYSPSYYAKKIPDYSYETSRATSILASPIPDELRRRSPMQKTNMKSPAKSTLILSPNRVTPPILDSQRLQQQEISVMKAENAMGSERIMLVNEIVYDRPDIVNNILKSVSGENSNILRGYPNMLEGNSDLLGPNKLDIEKPIYCTIKDEPELLPSVIDRPRPIQRRISRIISSGRRRSKSLGIIKSRATMTEAGTITLDPLPLPPPLPTRAANLKRLLQGDTSNMVHEEERLKYLFPAPPENQRLVNKLRRNLSLPNLAQMPSYKSLHNDIVSPDKPPNESMILDRLQNTSQSIDRDSEATSQMVSKISKKSSGVEDFGIFVSEKFDLTPRAPNSSNIIAISTEQQSTYNANLHNYQSSSNQTPNEDDTIDWDWLAELDPYETPVKKQSLTVNKTSVVNNMETQALNFDANSKDHEIVTVMLKTPVNDNDEGRRNQPPAIMFMPEENSRSISVNQKDKKSSSMKINQKVRRKLSEARDSWYCRIGERMPSFSGKRNEVFQTNKIPPPLILDRSKVEPIPEVRYSEPTPPYYPHESTNRALESQLSRMEEQEQNSIELLNEKIPINNAEIPLLESLEKEMEEQSNQWQNLQNNLDRESFISAISQLPTDSPRDSQKLITLGKINDICKHRVSNLSAISNNSDNISTDTWKKQLTEAQISYTNLYKQRSSYFKFSNFQISSPTPPESLNSETENNFESEDHNETPRPIRASISGNKNLLWRPAFPSNNNTSNIMWKPSNHSSANKDIIPPAADLRPPKRYTEQSLSIKSHSLWSKKAKNSNKTRSVSSWLSQTEIQPNYQNSEKMLNNFEPSDNIVDSYGKDNSFYSKLDDGYENMESLEDMEEIGDFNQYEEKFNESTLLTIAALLKTDNIPSDKSLLPLRQEIYSGTLIDDFPSQEFFPQDSVLPLTINQNFSTSQINNFQMYNLPTPTNIDYQGRESNNQFLEARESPKKISYIDALEEVSKSALWTLEFPSDITIQSIGLQQPSTETWSVLTSMSQDFLRIKPRKLSNNLPRFDTQSLWTKPTYKSKVKETGTTWKSFHAVSTKEDSSTNLSLISEEKNVNKQVDHQMLWTPKNLSNNTIQSVGLQQPSAETWSALTSTSQGNYRNKLRKFDMKIIKFREESLWTKSQHKIKVQENIRLWIKFENFETKNANNFKLIANANEETVESKVWNAKTFKNIIDRSVGLQQPSPEVWKSLKEFSEVVPLSSSRKIGSNLLDSGKNSLQTFKITSTKLWSHSEKQVKEINWISRSCVTQDQKQESKPKSESKTNGYLWKKKSVVLKTSFLGIDSSATFQPPSYPTEATLDGNTSTYRPKFVRLPLDQITSTKLWEKSINIPIQRDWISESSVRPESPTFSTSSSVPSSPNSDASSIFSISTKASSIWAVQEMPSRTAVPFVYPFISEVNPSELKLVQDSHRASKISNGPKLAKPTSLAAVLELNQQFSPKSQKKNDNQTPKHGAYPKKKSLKGVVSEEKDIALALSISKSTNPPTRTTATTPTDWKLALEEAILAGKSTNPPTRTTATTPADWKLALEEAILAGKSTSK